MTNHHTIGRGITTSSNSIQTPINIQASIRHGAKPRCQEDKVEGKVFSILEAEAFTLDKLEALVMKPMPRPKPDCKYRTKCKA